jgi:hypothetical protein
MVTKRTPPLAIWIVIVALALCAFAASVLIDDRYSKNNKFTQLVSQKITDFRPSDSKPLVVGIGNSLLMMGTPYDWNPEGFHWLRLVIQGSKITEFDLLAEQIVSLEPDLVLIGMNTLRQDALTTRSRTSLKRMARLPLEKLELVHAVARQEQPRNRCSEWTMERYQQRIAKQFSSPKNSLRNSVLIEKLIARNIPFAIVREPLLGEFEINLEMRERWLNVFSQDANQMAISVLGTSQTFDKKDFCADLMHMSKTGMERFTGWLHMSALQALGNPQ